MKNNIKRAKKDVDSAKKMLVGKNYSRVINLRGFTYLKKP